jgi:hypothetical protein
VIESWRFLRSIYVVLTEHGDAVAHAVHHASAMMAGDWLFA